MIIEPLVGKTYSLCGTESGSNYYYEHVRSVADQCLRMWGQENIGGVAELLSFVRTFSRSKRRLRQIAIGSTNSTFESILVHKLLKEFSLNTSSTAAHLRELPWAKRWDRTLATSEEQYHLYMLEIELQNRLDTGSFRLCDTKLGFLPHCLHDLSAMCRSVKRVEDYVCKGCSRACTINAVTKLLRRHGVQPYIWMTANLHSLFRSLKNEGRRPGVLGIACIPELVSGMRMCARVDVPVVGIPLDANRCARWWGEFHHNTVNLQQLDKLLGEETLKRARVHSES